jgi:hypothetical protein
VKKRKKAHGHTFVWVIAEATLFVDGTGTTTFKVPNIEWCSTCGMLIVGGTVRTVVK